MNSLMAQLQIRVNEKTHLKDPFTSELGRNILATSIQMIHEVGLEAFTFKKLATALHTAESSIYRYFENKHKLLIYLVSWYWGFLEYQMVFRTANRDDALENIKIALSILCQPISKAFKAESLDVATLHQIVISESSKAYMTKEVDLENKEGYFSGFKRLCNHISEFITAYNPDFTFPHTLVATTIEGIHHQIYFSEHIPSLSDFGNDPQSLSEAFYKMITATIQP